MHLRRIRFKAPETGTTLVFLKTQIWIAASVYVLVAIVRKRLNIEASLYTLMIQVFSVAIFEKVAIKTAFLPGAYGSEGDIENKQLNLFSFKPDGSAPGLIWVVLSVANGGPADGSQMGGAGSLQTDLPSALAQVETAGVLHHRNE